MARAKRIKSLDRRLLGVALVIGGALVCAPIAGAGAARGGAFAPLDRALQCTPSPMNGHSWISVVANADTPQGTDAGSKPVPARIELEGTTKDLWLSFDDTHSNVSLNGRLCHTAKPIPLTHSGLASAGVFKAGYYTSFAPKCQVTGSIVFRLRLNRDARGIPTNAELAVQTTKRIPLILIVWSPGNVATYASSRCQ
jgi:hypothetical protein